MSWMCGGGNGSAVKDPKPHPPKDGLLETYQSDFVIFVNGKKHELSSVVDIEKTLLTFLRDDLKLTGTKLVCAEGGCGACTVLITNIEARWVNGKWEDAIVHRPVNACLMPLCAAEGMSVTTVEGLGSVKSGLHAIQGRLVHSNGSQCGFCTPGIVMEMYSVLKNVEKPTVKDIEEAFDGNLCRCTGYRPILDGMKTFAVDHKEWAKKSCGEKCTCVQGKRNKEECCKDIYPHDHVADTAHDFPSELKDRGTRPLHYEIKRDGKDTFHWYRPTTLHDLLILKKMYPNARIIVGNTEVGIERRFKGSHYNVAVAPTAIDEMRVFNDDGKTFTLGASLTLEEIRQLVVTMKESRSTPIPNDICQAILDQLKYFAGHQIRCNASVGGNICTASPISDLNPVWVAANAVFTLVSIQGKRSVFAKDFFLDYRKIDMKPDEVLLSIQVPHTVPHEHVMAYKTARRRDDDIAVVNACMRVKLAGSKVSDIALSYGGVSKMTISAPETAKLLMDQDWSDESKSLEPAITSLSKEIAIPDDAPGGLVPYRREMVKAFFFMFWAHVVGAEKLASLPENFLADMQPIERDVSHAKQVYPSLEETPKGVHESVVHLGAQVQSTGEALYTDDIQVPESALRAHYVVSPYPHAKIVKIDPSKALEVDGVVAFIDHKDVPGDQRLGALVHDELVFAVDEVVAVGQPVGMVVAKTDDIARRAARLVAVEYQELPAIMTIEEAIKEESFFGSDEILSGDLDKVMSEAETVVEDSTTFGGQEHFYLEPHTALAIPDEDGRMVVESSTQAPTHTQIDVARALGIPMGKVISRVRRMGGGFGGKESRAAPLAVACAVAAHKLSVPVRMALDREMDMQFMGGRHAFLLKYKIGFNKDGKVKAMDAQLYANSGHSMDLSNPVLDRALFHVDNAYKWEALRVKGTMCRTNQASHTAFRGFGAPQGVFLAETVIDRVARECQMSPSAVRELNFYREGDLTHYQQTVFGFHLPAMWEQIKSEWEYEKKEKEVAAFNAAHQFRKRGVSISPIKFGMSFTVKLLNQAGALVHCYTDGTVLVSHGGTEMGQGLNTKMAQVAAEALGIELDQITVSDTATDKVPNTTPTSASSGADLNGAAILNACEKINERLEPLRAADPSASFASLCSKAFVERISLSATGYYRTPDIGYDFNKDYPERGRPFNYYSQGVACSMVEINTLTGDYQILSTHILMDVGKSLNPALDIGQIEGAFVQGIGLMTLEELVWGTHENPWIPPGHLFTKGPGTYKIPGFANIPIDFQVTLLDNVDNPRAVYSSKGIGEPPLLLAHSVYFAIKEAIYAHREATKQDRSFIALPSPVTMAAIARECQTKLSSQQ